MVERKTPRTTILLEVGILKRYTLHDHTAGIERNTPWNVHTVDTLHLHTAGNGQEHSLQAHILLVVVVKGIFTPCTSKLLVEEWDTTCPYC